MQIHTNTLIAECSAYDFKEMLERKKVKSWLKSVSAFANTDGGSLFYGVNDDGVIVGLENPQADADFISEMIKARLDPVPEVQLIPTRAAKFSAIICGMDLLLSIGAILPPLEIWKFRCCLPRS